MKEKKGYIEIVFSASSSQQKVVRKSLEKLPIVLGRSKQCALTLQHSRVSRFHCQLDFDGQDLIVTDLNSANGTFLNGKKLESEIDTVVTNGSQLIVGQCPWKITLNLKISDAERAQFSQFSDESSIQQINTQVFRTAGGTNNTAKSKAQYSMPQATRNSFPTKQTTQFNNELDDMDYTSAEKSHMEWNEDSEILPIQDDRIDQVSRVADILRTAKEESLKIKNEAETFLQKKQIEAGETIRRARQKEKEILDAFEENYQRELKNFEAEKEELRNQNQDLRKELKELNNKRAEVEMQLNSLKSEREEFKESISDLTRAIEKGKKEQRETRKVFEDYLEEVAKKKQQAKKKLNDFEEQIKKDQEKLQAEQQMLEAKAIKKRADVEVSVAEKQREIHEAEVTLRSLAKEQEVAIQEREIAEKKVAQAEEAFRELQKRSDEKESYLKEYDLNVQKLRQKMEDLQEQSLRLKEEKSSLDVEVQSLKKEKAKNESEMADLQRRTKEEVESKLSDAMIDCSDMREEAENKAQELKSQAEEYSQKTQQEADQYSENIRHEADVYEKETRARVDQEIQDLKASANNYSKETRDKAEQEAKGLRESAENYSLSLRKEVDEEVEKLRRDVQNECDELRNEVVAFVREKKQSALNEKQKIRENTQVEAEKLLEEARQKAIERREELIAGAAAKFKEAEIEKQQILEDAKEKSRLAVEKAHDEVDSLWQQSEKELEQKINTERMESEESLRLQRETALGEIDELKRLAKVEMEDARSKMESENIAKARALDIELKEIREEREKELDKLKKDYLREQRLRKNFEAKEIAKSVELLFDRTLKKIGKVDGVGSLKLSGEILNIVKEVSEERLPEEFGQIKERFHFDASVIERQKVYWIKMGGKVALVLLLVVALFNYKSIGSWVAERIKTDESASDIFIQRFQDALANKPKFLPKTSPRYFENYAKNVVFSEGYVVMKLRPDLQKKWVLSLNEYFVEKLGLHDEVIVEFIAEEQGLIKDLIPLFEKINPEHEKAGFERMEKREKESRVVFSRLLGSDLLYRRFRSFESSFYEDFLKYGATQNRPRSPANE